MHRLRRSLTTIVAASLAVLVTSGMAFAICGDGTLDGGEACDDGNTVGGDGCDFICQLE